jgi:hypothetical protein
MKHVPQNALLGAALLALGLASCRSIEANNHWRPESVITSAKYQFFGTLPLEWSAFKEGVAGGTGHVAKTFRRHLLNNNPDNPLQRSYRILGPSDPNPPRRKFRVGK